MPVLLYSAAYLNRPKAAKPNSTGAKAPLSPPPPIFWHHAAPSILPSPPHFFYFQQEWQAQSTL